MQKASSSSGARLTRCLDMVQLRSNHRLRAMPVPQTLVVSEMHVCNRNSKSDNICRSCRAVLFRTQYEKRGLEAPGCMYHAYGRDQPRCLCFQTVLMQVSDESCPQRNHLSRLHQRHDCILVAWFTNLHCDLHGLDKSPKPQTLH